MPTQAGLSAELRTRFGSGRACEVNTHPSVGEVSHLSRKPGLLRNSCRPLKLKRCATQNQARLPELWIYASAHFSQKRREVGHAVGRTNVRQRLKAGLTMGRWRRDWKPRPFKTSALILASLLGLVCWLPLRGSRCVSFPLRAWPHAIRNAWPRWLRLWRRADRWLPSWES
jgi:hypothetical protein